MVNCQLYKYSKVFFSLRRESAEFFANNFTQNEIDEDHTAWLNFHKLDEIKHIESLCQNLEIDQLCVESIFTETKRAKVEEYDNYMFFSIKSALPSESEDELIISDQITFVLSHDYLISFQEKSSDYFKTIRERIEKNKGVIRKKSTDFLLFRMLESIIDNYFNVIESISDNINKIDQKIHLSDDKSIMANIELEKRKLIELRKIAIPMRDITVQLENASTPFIHEPNQHYFVNLKFLCESVLEEIDANKQILDGLTNLYYAAQGQRMNEIMKILTVVSAIFIPLTFIAGVYGMNFVHIPELQYTYGYYVVMGGMFLMGISLLVFFWKRGWLKK
jgi:magnesium transporter